MALSRSHIEELDRALEENRALNEQVKKLIRAERRLTVSQQELDRQIERVEALNRFALDAGHLDKVPQIYALAVEALFSLFPFEQATCFAKGESGVFAPVVSRAVPGRGPAKDHVPSEVDLTRLDAAELPRTPMVASADEMGGRSQALRPFIDYLIGTFRSDRREERVGECVLLAIPVFGLGDHDVQGLILLRRLTHELSFLEHLPTREDVPFLRLFSAHVASAVQTMLLHQMTLRLYQEARDAIRIRDEFLSIASHELKTPLTTIMLLVKSVKKGADLGKTAADRMTHVERQCERLERLIDQLLDVSRIRVGRLDLEFDDIDLGALVGDLVARLGDDFLASKTPLKLSCPPGIRLRCDREKIEQVVLNLLRNALKFGAGQPIEVEVEGDAKNALIRVRDHGIGISPEDQARVFHRFERAVSERNFGGLGLGLYVTQQIVEAHGGKISVESKIGAGATFVVELPRMGL